MEKNKWKHKQQTKRWTNNNNNHNQVGQNSTGIRTIASILMNSPEKISTQTPMNLNRIISITEKWNRYADSCQKSFDKMSTAYNVNKTW